MNRKPRHIRNCHTKGLDSIIISTDPVIRVYLAHAHHDLWRNEPPFAGMSIGFHCHAYDVLLWALSGAVSNITLNSAPSEEYGSLMMTHYDGRRLERVGSFRYKPHVTITSLVAPMELAGIEFHTVSVPRGERAAWIVHEGRPSPPSTTVFTDHVGWTSEGLYSPMTDAEAQHALDEFETGLKAGKLGEEL